jgi:hypothetical protein
LQSVSQNTSCDASHISHNHLILLLFHGNKVTEIDLRMPSGASMLKPSMGYPNNNTMNRLTNQFLHSVQGWLGKHAEPTPKKKEGDLDSIRKAMLDALGEEGCLRYPDIERRILFAADSHALWYLRPKLMQALSSLQGEGGAYEKLRDITAQFAGCMPHSMPLRAAALGR